MIDDEMKAPASQEFKDAWLKATKRELDIEELEDAFNYLDEFFGHDIARARWTLAHWLETFSDEPPEVRARKAFEA